MVSCGIISLYNVTFSRFGLHLDSCFLAYFARLVVLGFSLCLVKEKAIIEGHSAGSGFSEKCCKEEEKEKKGQSSPISSGKMDYIFFLMRRREFRVRHGYISPEFGSVLQSVHLTDSHTSSPLTPLCIELNTDFLLCTGASLFISTNFALSTTKN